MGRLSFKVSGLVLFGNGFTWAVLQLSGDILSSRKILTMFVMKCNIRGQLNNIIFSCIESYPATSDFISKRVNYVFRYTVKKIEIRSQFSYFCCRNEVLSIEQSGYY